jgi:hypothetical protein
MPAFLEQINTLETLEDVAFNDDSGYTLEALML